MTEFCSVELQKPHAERVAQISRAHISMVGLVSVGFGVFYAALGCYFALSVVAALALVMGLLLVTPLSVERRVSITAITGVVGSLALVAVLGGPAGPNVGWALVGPMVSLLLLGRRARWNIGLSLGGLVVMHGLELAGFPMLYDVPESLRPPLERASTIAFTAFMGGSFYWYLLVFEKQNDALIDELGHRRVAEEQAQSADKLKSQFLANMSHELRTPLNGVLGTVQVLKVAGLSTEQKRYTSLIESSGQSLMAMLNEILDFSKIESGHLRLESRPVALVPLAEEVASLLAGQAQPKGVTLHAILDPAALAPVHGDASRIRQILVNLLSNAIKFTASGHVVLRLRDDPAAQRRVFIVEDTGVGMPPEVAEEIFEPFRQAEASTARRFGGTGLGLSIARQLARQMGGDITLLSTSSSGTAFSFWLPAPEAPLPLPPTRAERGTAAVISDDPLLHAAVSPWLVHWGFVLVDEVQRADLVLRDGAAAPGEIALLGFGAAAHQEGVLARPLQRVELCAACRVDDVAGEESTISTLRWQGTRALVVDDHPINRVVASNLLVRLLGFTVETADSGAAAIEAVAAQTFDVVFMDVQMPEMDGLETTRRLRAGGFTALIVALTANAFAEDREQALESGMDDHISKPIHAESLLSKLDALRGPRRVRL